MRFHLVGNCSIDKVYSDNGIKEFNGGPVRFMSNVLDRLGVEYFVYSNVLEQDLPIIEIFDNKAVVIGNTESLTVRLSSVIKTIQS